MYFALVCFTSLLSFLVRRCLAEKAGVELPTAGVEGRGACTTGRRGRAARRGHQRRQRLGLLVGRVAMRILGRVHAWGFIRMGGMGTKA
jgi:hypothetical protein